MWISKTASGEQRADPQSTAESLSDLCLAFLFQRAAPLSNKEGTRIYDTIYLQTPVSSEENEVREVISESL